jgi:NADP-dependent 3-hydroxy acid dehydrogenase YdfG
MPDREVVVVTGASAGIGRATVREFARHEARIALIARAPERLEARAIAIPPNTSDFQALEAAAAAEVAAHRPPATPAAPPLNTIHQARQP